MTQPTLLSLGTPSPVKMAKKQAGGGGEFRSMLDRDPTARELPKQGDAGSDEALGPASLRARISFEVAGPSKSDRIEGDDDETDDPSAEPEDETVATAPAVETTAVGELRFLLGNADRHGRTSTLGAATEHIYTSRRAEAAPSRAVAHNAGEPAGEGGDGTAVALPGADGADAEQPAARQVAVDAPPGRAVEKVPAQVTPAASKDAPKAGQEVAASREAKPAPDMVAPAANGKGSSEARHDGAGQQRDGRSESKPSLAGATVVTEAPANAPAAAQPAARAVVATLGADPSWSAYFLAKPAPAQSTPQALTVQLRPAELGVVSAHLSFNGDSLTVELRPETQEAHNQLSRDSDAIARSLRAIGMEVDHVTVQPASTAQDGGRAALNARSDGQGNGQQGQGAAFTSPDSQGERGGGRQQGQGNPSGFGSRSGGDEMRGGAGGGDRDGRYI